MELLIDRSENLEAGVKFSLSYSAISILFSFIVGGINVITLRDHWPSVIPISWSLVVTTGAFLLVSQPKADYLTVLGRMLVIMI